MTGPGVAAGGTGRSSPPSRATDPQHPPPGIPAVPVQVRWLPPQPWRVVAAWLDRDDRRRVHELRRDADRDRSATGRALLRLLAAQWMALPPNQIRWTATCPVCGSERHGKPGVAEVPGAGRPPHVSIAHAGDRVVVALTAAGPVGVDLEREDAAGFEGFDEVALAAPERAALAAEPPGQLTAARARVWVRKEAALKASGHGLAVPLPRLTVTTSAGSPRLLSWRGHQEWAESLVLQDFCAADGHVGCVAVRPPAGTAVSVQVSPFDVAGLRAGPPAAG